MFDFYKQLRSHPTYLQVLGNGRQRKSYLHVQDCLDAMLLAKSHATARINLFNLGVEAHCEVNDSIAWISAELGLQPQVTYTRWRPGLVGDNPYIFSRHDADTRPGVAAAARDRRRHPQDRRLPARQHLATGLQIMIIARSPLRVTLGGGGTDLPRTTAAMRVS